MRARGGRLIHRNSLSVPIAVSTTRDRASQNSEIERILPTGNLAAFYRICRKRVVYGSSKLPIANTVKALHIVKNFSVSNLGRQARAGWIWSHRSALGGWVLLYDTPILFGYTSRGWTTCFWICFDLNILVGSVSPLYSPVKTRPSMR